MKVDFYHITRLSPTSFTISLPRKTQITPPYAKLQKNKNIKIKLCLHYSIKSNIHFWLNREDGKFLHSWYRGASPPILWRPLYIAYPFFSNFVEFLTHNVIFYWYSNLIPHTQIYKAHSGASRLTDPYKYMFAPTVMCPQQLPLLY